MKSFVLALAALLLTPVCLAQPPNAAAEFNALIDAIEDETGLKRYGGAMVSDIGDGESLTLKVKVDNTQLTYLQLACDGYCFAIKPEVSTRAGAVIAPELPDATMPVIQVPAGSGDEIDLSIFMSCEYSYCSVGVQALVR